MGTPELEELDELELLEELELDDDEDEELDDSPGSVPPPHATNNMLNKPAPARRAENPVLIRMLMKIALRCSRMPPSLGATFYSALLYC